MTSRLNPYLNFDGSARQAMEFYREVFGGTLTLTTFAELGAPPDSPDGSRIMHGSLETDHGFVLMGSDVMSDMEFRPGNALSVCLNGDDVDELRRWWTQLADGATVLVPLEVQPWGDEFGMCIDRYGTPWMVDIGQGT